MKVFKNERTQNNNELPIRRGTRVPEGAVSLGWYDTPDLTPKDNLVTIDTSRFEGADRTGLSLAYGNSLGILEDEYGNQAWPEEFPVVGDQFLLPEDISNASEFLPYAHISRHFHLDKKGLAFGGSLSPMPEQPTLKVVNSDGGDYVDDEGRPRYKIHGVNVKLNQPGSSRTGMYRIWVFLDMDPVNDDLFLVYHKAEYDNGTGYFRDEYIGYKEPLSVREYYRHVLEEVEVLDQGSYDKKIYSTQPIDFKDQIVGRSQPNYKGWKIQVPRKAIPDPRKFEVFRWRVACEYSRTVDPNENNSGDSPTRIRAGVVTFNSVGTGASRSNYIFAQLNESSYNTGGIEFYNPLNENNGSLSPNDAEYWSVPIHEINNQDLQSFDILIWSATAPSVDVGDSIMPKIAYFTQTLGRTFVFESCSKTVFNNIPGIELSTRLRDYRSTNSDRVTVADLRYYDDIPSDQTLIPDRYATWPPKVEDVFNDNLHSSALLRELNFLGGWNLDSENELRASSLMNSGAVNNLFLQNLTSVDSEWETILESDSPSGDETLPVMARKKFNSGGNIFVSTAGTFEDHIVDSEGSILSSAFNVGSLLEMSPTAREQFSFAADSISMEGEMKLRMNIAMLATAFRPVTNLSVSPTEGFNQNYERHSVTVYSDWESSWVINAHNDVLSTEEKAKHNFVLMPKDREDPNPVWMRMLSNKTVAEIMAEKINEIDPDGQNETFQNQEGLQKKYVLMVTNSNVETFRSNVTFDQTVPAAWTYTHSPPFNVPYDLGPYAIREEMVAGTGVGEGYRTYPERPFRVRSMGSYVTTGVEADELNVSVKFTGTAKRVFRIPAEEITTQLPVPAYSFGEWIDVQLRCLKDNNPTLVTPASIWGSSRPHLDDMLQPHGVTTLTDAQYNDGGVTSYASWAMHGNYRIGASGSIVRLIQRLINQFIFFGKIDRGRYIVEDGYYGQITANQILKLQQTRNAIWQNGEVDSETWALIGYSLAALWNWSGWGGRNDDELNRFGITADRYLRLDRVSSLQNLNWGYMKQSASSRYNPGRISESWLLSFDGQYSDYDVGFEGNLFDMYALVVRPYFHTYDNAKTAVIDWVDVKSLPPDGPGMRLGSYNFSSGSPGPMNVTVRDSQYTTIPFTRRLGNQVLFRMRKNGQTGGTWGSQRMMGIQDAYVLAKYYIPNTSPPPVPETETEVIPGRTITETLTIEAEQNFTLRTGIPRLASTFISDNSALDGVRITNITGSESNVMGYPTEITEVRWTSYEVTPASKAGAIQFSPVQSTINGDIVSETFRLLYNDATTDVSNPNYIMGDRIGDGSTDFWIKPLGGDVEPFSRQYGLVRKNQGVVLICDEDGRPMGFPAGAPRLGGEESNFTRLTMEAWEVDQTIYYGFYDVSRDEWVENANGQPSMSYYDYVRRGVDNIYMAVQTTYELDAQSNLPSPDEPVLRPYKLAMPVYGVKTRNETSVKLQNPSEELGHKDIWPVLVGTGSFSRQVAISQSYADVATNFLKDYGNKTITAHYSLREGTRGPWSPLLGKPYKENKNEEPRLLSDDTFRINFAPIASVQEPTYYPGPADPVTPFFTVYRKDTLTSPWTEVALEDIKEYDLSKGIITLKTPLPEDDPRLLKVDYISRDYTYRYAHDGEKRVNLNPYILNKTGDDGNHLNVTDKPLYVYLVPSFLVENDGKTVISNTHEDRILRITEDKSIFNPSQVNYDPMAYQIGIIFTLTSVDLTKLNILDTRVRGGGVQHHLETEELKQDDSSYWDSVNNKPYSYQKGGFVIIRLPAEIVEDFNTEEKLREVISRNLTAGVAYKFEDYSGQPLFGG